MMKKYNSEDFRKSEMIRSSLCNSSFHLLCLRLCVCVCVCVCVCIYILDSSHAYQHQVPCKKYHALCSILSLCNNTPQSEDSSQIEMTPSNAHRNGCFLLD
jgi:hypothetical protein